MKLRRALPVAFACLLIVAPAAWASHSQPIPGGGTIAFKDKAGGNEWWVEAIVSSTSPVSKVEVMDDGGAWATMTHRPEWGSWAASYHVEPGHRVTFRATTAAGVVVSCPFTHPAGVEQCTVPPAAWDSDLYDGVSEFVSDMATGDTDGDGRGELYLAGDLALWQSKAPIVSGLEQWSAVALGDLDRNGRAEVYASRYDGVGGWEVHQFVRSGSGWTGRIIFDPANVFVGALSVGDVDRDGQLDLYAVGSDGNGHGAAWQLRRTATGPFAATRILDVQHSTAGWSVDALWMWIGDADRDGQAEVATVVAGRDYSRVFVIDYATSWRTLDAGETLEFPGPIVAGDVDGDGRGEMALAGLTSLETITLQNGAWVHQRVLSFEGPVQDLSLGDGDNDGREELYVLDWTDVILVRKVGAGWTTALIGSVPEPGNRLIVGDGDMDGVREVFAAWMDDHRVTWVTRLQKSSTAAFDATFTGVRGNEWWVQAGVSGNGATVASVDVRLNGGAWQPLKKQSWGGYAASYHIVQGMTVQMRATSTSGAIDLSDCYRWIPAPNTDATKVACPNEPQPGTFDATFSAVRGNEWWAEAVITANRDIYGVFLTIDCDTSRDPADMTYNAQWGKWVLGNTYIPNGSKVTLYAFGDGGAEESQGYIWPNGTPTTGC